MVMMIEMMIKMVMITVTVVILLMMMMMMMMMMCSGNMDSDLLCGKLNATKKNALFALVFAVAGLSAIGAVTQAVTPKHIQRSGRLHRF